MQPQETNAKTSDHPPPKKAALSRVRQAQLAFVFLTRLPAGRLPPVPPGALAGAGWAFPLVGLAVGGLAGGVYFTAQLAGLPALAAALLAVLSAVFATGALHEDGLADCADGFGGGHDKARKLEIMRDSRLGSYGALALVASLGLRASALAALPPFAGLCLLIAAHTAGRGLLPVMMRVLPNARAEGLAATGGRPGTATVLAALLLTLGIATGAILTAGFGPLGLVLALLLPLLLLFFWCRLCQRQIGGMTGDTLGGLEQLTEIVVLLLAAALAGRATAL